jgi:CHAD domain-containing protein
LAVASNGYRLKRDESAADGLRRVARGRAEKAVERLREADGGDQAVLIHGARKDLKKLRAVLRLVGEDVGRKTYRAENRRYRDAGRLLSPSRDAEVKVETLEALEEHGGDDLPGAASSIWRSALEADRERVADAADGEAAAKIAAAIEQIGSGLEQISEWPLRKDSWSLLEPGLTRSYRQGRKALGRAAADADAANVHQLRKRAKDLWYQLRLLEDAWPELLGASGEAVHGLADLLGDHHDLALLAEDLRARGDSVAEREGFESLIAARQKELWERALAIGERVYAEKPKCFRRRIRAYWRAWRVD